jgi:radical SAM protein with 4Fe4S-binding SPASM domain
MNKAMIEEVKRSKDPFVSIACYYPWYNISIFADGRALPCFILKDKGENVREKSLKEIWFGKYFNEIREIFLKNKLKEDCSKCNPWNLPKMKEIRNELQF